MRFLGATLVCIAVLYGVDAVWFNGAYFNAATSMMLEIVRHSR